MSKKILMNHSAKYLIYIVLFLLFPVSLMCFWADSEMWAAIASAKLFGSYEQFSFSMKPVFHAVLYLSSRFSEFFSFHPMDGARLIFSLNAVVLGFLFLRVLESYKTPKKQQFFIALLLFSSSLFIERVFRVRSDFLALSVILLSLYLYRRNKHLAVLGFGFFVSFLVTPKSVLFLFICFPVWIKREHFYFFKNKKTMLKIILFLLAAMSLVIVFRDIHIFKSLKYSLNYFLSSFGSYDGGGSYFSVERFRYIFLFIQKNILVILYLLYFVGFVLWDKLKNSYNLINRNRLSLLLSLLVLCFSPNRLPFFILSILILSLIFVSMDRRFIEHLTNRWGSISIFVQSLVVVLLLMVGFYAAHNLYVNNNNFKQRKVSKVLSDFYVGKKYRIYDPVGILNTNESLNWFLGPAQNKRNEFVFELIKAEKFDVILYARKLLYLEPALGQYLRMNYICSSYGVCIKALVYKGNLKKLTQEILNKDLKEKFTNIVNPQMKEVRLYNEEGLNISNTFKPKSDLSKKARMVLISALEFPQDYPAQNLLLELFQYDLDI